MKDRLAVESPCISVCELNLKTGLCEGCWRTSNEIKVWQQCSDYTRIEILRKCRQRKMSAGFSFRHESKRKILS